MSRESQSQRLAAEELVSAAGGQMPHEPGGSVRAALANAMVGLKKQHYGRGPTAAKATRRRCSQTARRTSSGPTASRSRRR
jgi:hypothetical protein